MTDLLKLIFHHDQRMEQLAPSSKVDDNPLAMFMAPDPTFSTLYFSGTVLEEKKFGLNNLAKYHDIVSLIDSAFDLASFKMNSDTFADAIDQLELNNTLLIDPKKKEIMVDDYSGGMELRTAIEADGIVLFKRENHDGFDIQLFSKDNIYLLFFYHLKAMLSPSFRVFSINGKRVHNEQSFFFETHRLNKPPHGFEEVFPESVL
jgi:hypothetical protein